MHTYSVQLTSVNGVGRDQWRAQFLAQPGVPPITVSDTIRLLQPADTAHARGSVHHGVWFLAHEATALAALGDTAKLRTVADSAERIGAGGTDIGRRAA